MNQNGISSRDLLQIKVPDWCKFTLKLKLKWTFAEPLFWEQNKELTFSRGRFYCASVWSLTSSSGAVKDIVTFVSNASLRQKYNSSVHDCHNPLHLLWPWFEWDLFSRSELGHGRAALMATATTGNCMWWDNWLNYWNVTFLYVLFQVQALNDGLYWQFHSRSKCSAKAIVF